MSQEQEYDKAMINGDIDRCIVIEQQAGLSGYPPELVVVGLAAIDDGLDAELAINEHVMNFGEADKPC